MEGNEKIGGEKLNRTGKKSEDRGKLPVSLGKVFSGRRRKVEKKNE